MIQGQVRCNERMSIAISSYDNTFDNNVLIWAEAMMTSQNAVAKIWITIYKEERSHILSTEVFAPTSRSFDDITRANQGGREMRWIEALNC